MKFTETGKTVYDRTYSRTKPNGEKEVWSETVRRVVDGNLGLVPENRWIDYERERLIELMEEFKILPAGRHLWASGVKGRQYLFNCHVSGWNPAHITDHFEFTFMRLMEGGGVGANYSNRFLEQYGEIKGSYEVHIVCDPEHPDYEKMLCAGVLSTEYNSDWEGSFEVEDSREGWALALVDLISTFYRSGVKNRNRVFDVSRVRAEGARLKTFGGRASGPLPLAVMLREVEDILNTAEMTVGKTLTGIDAMEIDHAIAKCVVSGGNRRSARMAIMHWTDPQIGEFLHCKQDTGSHWTTNISVEVDNAFWDSLEGKYGADMTARAFDVLTLISKGMLRDGEPGIWDSSYSNFGEPNQVVATNPCGEIALEAWENCNLGHVNLAAFVNGDGNYDYAELAEAHILMTRFLMRATYGDVNDPKQAETLARNRRIGVGHFGVASYLALTGTRYSDAPYSTFPEMLADLATEVEEAAKRYAHQLRIPVPVKTRTVAPTGTIAKMPGVSEGIHPIFAKYFIRRIRFSDIDQDQWAQALEYATKGYDIEPCQYAPNTTVVAIPTKDSLLEEVTALHGTEKAEYIVESAADLSLSSMLEFQAMYQTYWADNAVSYTANIDPTEYTVEHLAMVIKEFGGEVKGFTVFPEMSRPQSPYERISKEEFEAFELTQTADGVDEDCASGACPVR